VGDKAQKERVKFFKPERFEKREKYQKVRCMLGGRIAKWITRLTRKDTVENRYKEKKPRGMGGASELLRSKKDKRVINKGLLRRLQNQEKKRRLKKQGRGKRRWNALVP